MTHTSTRLILTSLLVLLLAAAVPAAGQTFTETLITGTTDLYLFGAAAGGQYEVTVTWEDPASSIAILIVCESDADPLGLSTGARDRTARLSIGIGGSQDCAVGLGLVAGALSDYTLNFQSTDNASVTKAATAEAAEGFRQKAAGVFASLRDFGAEPAAEKGAASKGIVGPVGPTRTFLEQIQGGVPKSFFVDVDKAGLLQITAMWNRMDTNLSISMICRDGSSEVPWGRSESRQERILRFDADVISGTTCEIILESPRTMVFALNVAFLDNGGLLPSI